MHDIFLKLEKVQKHTYYACIYTVQKPQKKKSHRYSIFNSPSARNCKKKSSTMKTPVKITRDAQQMFSMVSTIF